MATIVQNYGPIYGEVVNGTVQGRPNGSVYVPISNTITMSLLNQAYYTVNGGVFRLCASDGTVSWSRDAATVVAQSQDLSSNIKIVLYDEASLTTVLGTNSAAAGNFNTLFRGTTKDDDPSGTSAYLVAYLMNNNTPVATSAAIELEYVSP